MAQAHRKGHGRRHAGQFGRFFDRNPQAIGHLLQPLLHAGHHAVAIVIAQRQDPVRRLFHEPQQAAHGHPTGHFPRRHAAQPVGHYHAVAGLHEWGHVFAGQVAAQGAQVPAKLNRQITILVVLAHPARIGEPGEVDGILRPGGRRNIWRGTRKFDRISHGIDDHRAVLRVCRAAYRARADSSKQLPPG